MGSYISYNTHTNTHTHTHTHTLTHTHTHTHTHTSQISTNEGVRVVRVRLRVDLAFGPRAFARGPGVRVRLRVDAPAPAHALALLVCSLWFARSRVFMRAMRVLCSTCAKTALPAPFGAESPGNIGCQSGQIVDVSIRWPRNSGSGSWPKWPGRCSGPGGSAACAGRWRPPRLLSGVPGICARARAEPPGRAAAEPLSKKIGAGPAITFQRCRAAGACAGGSPGARKMRASAVYTYACIHTCTYINIHVYIWT